MVPPHGLRKLKVALYQFLRVRFTRLVRPVNQMCTKCSHDRYSDLLPLREIITEGIRPTLTTTAWATRSVYVILC